MAVTNSLYKIDNGDSPDVDEVISNQSFILNNMLAYALDGATTTNQHNLFMDLFTSDTAQSMTNLTYDSGNDWYETTDQSVFADYYMDIYTTTTTGISALNINNCLTIKIYEDGSGYVYRMYSTSGTAEVQRAEVMKTLFYGTNGSDEKVSGITGLTNLKSSDSRDVGKRAFYFYIACSPNASLNSGLTGNEYNDLTITFNDTSTNTDCSVWSYTHGRGDSTYGKWGTAYCEFPTSTVVNSASSGTSDETGTDTSAEEADNPATMMLRQRSPNTGGTTYGGSQSAGIARAIVLCSGSTSTNYTETWEASEFSEGSHIDFYTDHSIPLIEAATITSDDAILVTGTKTLASEDAVIIKQLSEIDSSNSLQVEFSADGGSNYQVVTESVLSDITNTGTTGQLRFTITRTDNTVEDRLKAYAYYVG